jgi:hypothetical protein
MYLCNRAAFDLQQRLGELLLSTHSKGSDTARGQHNGYVRAPAEVDSVCINTHAPAVPASPLQARLQASDEFREFLAWDTAYKVACYLGWVYILR